AQQLLELKPADSGAFRCLVQVHAARGDPAGVQRVCESFFRAVKDLPLREPLDYCDRAWFHLQLREVQSALDELEAARHKDPTFTKAFLERAELLLELKRFKEALEACSQLLERDPSAAEAYRFQSVALMATGNPAESYQVDQKALAALPRELDYASDRAWFFEDLEDYGAAVSEITAALRKAPDCVGYYRQRARLYRLQHHYDKALEDYNEALKLAPHAAALYAERRALRQEQGNFPEAMSDYEQAININRRCGTAYLGYAACLFRAKDEAGAQKVIEQGLNERFNPPETGAD